METAVRLVGEAKEKISGAEISITSMDSISGEFDLLIKLRLWEWYLRPERQCPVTAREINRPGCRSGFRTPFYNPVKTKLIQYAEEAGIAAVGGMSMLVLQAVSAHEIWDGDSYADEQINTIISDAAKIVERDFN